MKWSSKGHEFDNRIEEMKKRIGEVPKVYIFGAGLVGKREAELYKKLECLEGFIDNDKNKIGLDYEGCKVISFDEYLNKRDGFIIIGVGRKNKASVIQQMELAGLVRDKDFFELQDFEDIILPLLEYNNDLVYVKLAQISLTERCTLHCKKCAHGCYAVPPTKADLQISEVYRSADAFFGIVDYIQEFVLIGGEPFLYREMDKAISYIGDKYREKIGIFSITTNGTIIPNEEIMRLCNKYDVTIRISNYQIAIPGLKKQYELLTNILSDHGVRYYLGAENHQWMDYGFDYVNHGGEEDKLIEVFDKCKTPCREIRGDRYYYCVMARTVSENLGFNNGKEDYLDLRKNNGNKKIFIEFERGFSDKGYLDMCNYCHGAEVVNHLIPVAEQV